MKSTKKLLSITNLKKYFPIAKSSIFQKEQLYVKANEEITLDIYEGETLGVVGESGCGKSTLGRVLLQLYPQTAGESMYYGRKLQDVAPAYVRRTLKGLKKETAKYHTLKAKADALDEQVAAIGEDNAEFFLLQNRNLARAEAETQLNHIVKIAGGFFIFGAPTEGSNLIVKIFETAVVLTKNKNKRNALIVQLDYLASKPPIVQDDGTVVPQEETARYKKLSAKLEETKVRIDELRAVRDAYKARLAEIKEEYADNEEFQKYEAMLDNGIDLARLRYKEIRPLRRDLQIIFQDPYSSLNPRFTIGQIIEEGLTTHKFYRHGSQQMKQYILDTMDKCGLQNYMMHRYPHQFSGGQRQRICIARALAVKPKFVVCDECVSALDVSIQSQIINLLQELKEKENLTYLFISHDLSVVRYISDRICVMYLGSVVELADAETVFKDPRHPYTIALLSSIPTTDIDSLSKERILLEGNIPSPIKPPSGCKFHTRCYMACDKCKNVPPPLVEVEPGHFVACHKLERKLDDMGNYLFEIPKTERKRQKPEAAAEAADITAEEATPAVEATVSGDTENA